MVVLLVFGTPLVTLSYVSLNELLQSAVDWIVDLQKLFEIPATEGNWARI